MIDLSRFIDSISGNTLLVSIVFLFFLLLLISETLNKTLADFKLTHGTCLQCDDFRQDFTIQLILSCISVELANALPTPSDSSTSTSTLNFNMDSRLTEQFNNEEQQSEIWRIVGDINSILSNSKDNTVSEKNAEKENNENTGIERTYLYIFLDKYLEIS